VTETSLDILWQFSENVQKCLSRLWTNFGESSEIIGKSPKTSLCIVSMLYNKKKITWSLEDTKCFFPC